MSKKQITVLYRNAGNSSFLQPVTIDPLKGIVDGFPIVFDKRANISNLFYEEIAPDALNDADLSDFVLLANHDFKMIPLARHRRGARSTMDIEIQKTGLFIKSQLDIENNTTAKMLCSAIQRGDMEGMSFAFGVEIDGEEWFDIQAEMPVRRITKIRKVFEVSVVTNPAYTQTSINARSAATLDNEKRVLENARAAALDNGKSAHDNLALEIEQYLFLEENTQ